MEETDQNGSALNEYLYLGGQRMARVPQLSPLALLGYRPIKKDVTPPKCQSALHFPSRTHRSHRRQNRQNPSPILFAG